MGMIGISATMQFSEQHKQIIQNRL